MVASSFLLFTLFVFYENSHLQKIYSPASLVVKEI